jgi:pimeloyl-ACP methyl ester carboxylesterase
MTAEAGVETSRSATGDHRHRLISAGVILEGLAGAVIVAAHGSLAWQMGRAALVLTVTLTASIALRRSGPRGVAVTTFLVGCAGVIGGIGIGVWHIAHGSTSVKALAGMLMLVVGVPLFVVGAVALVRSARRWWKLLALPIAFVLLEFVLIPVTFGVIGANVPREALDAATPADQGLEFENVTFRTADGVRLSGWYIPSGNGAVVIALHGASSTRSDVLSHAVVLAERGFGALLFDARGHGRSEGTGMALGWYGDLDVRAAVTFVERRPDVDPDRIAVLGESMGGEEALGAAAADDRIRAVVAEGATGRVGGDAGQGHAGFVERTMGWIQDQVADVLTDAERPGTLHDAVAAVAPRPILLIAGNRGEEIRTNRYLRDAAPGSVDLWVLSDTDHTKGLETHPKEWTRRVTEFLERALS